MKTTTILHTKYVMALGLITSGLANFPPYDIDDQPLGTYVYYDDDVYQVRVTKDEFVVTRVWRQSERKWVEPTEEDIAEANLCVDVDKWLKDLKDTDGQPYLPKRYPQVYPSVYVRRK